MPPQSAAAQDASAAPAREYGAQTGRTYTYDRAYAKQNHADAIVIYIHSHINAGRQFGIYFAGT